MEAFHPGTVFSSIDHGGRYSWVNQPAIGEWNLARFAETLLPLLDATDQESALAEARGALSEFGVAFSAELSGVFRRKLGLNDARDDDEGIKQFIDSTFFGHGDAKGRLYPLLH